VRTGYVSNNAPATRTSDAQLEGLCRALLRESVIDVALVLSVHVVEANGDRWQGHPGLAFGTEIDVRPVKVVVRPDR